MYNNTGGFVKLMVTYCMTLHCLHTYGMTRDNVIGE